MENMKRFFYNPDNNKLYLFENSHAGYYANNKVKLIKGFDAYIRGIIDNDILFLRMFYPYDDIDAKSFLDIKQASFSILKTFENDILKELKKEGLYIKKTVVNVTNESLKDILNLQYV